MSAMAPRLRPARVTVVLTDGRTATQELRQPRGDFYEPFAEDELRGKFRELAGCVLTTEGAAQVEQAIDHCADWATIDALTTLCRRHDRAP